MKYFKLLIQNHVGMTDYVAYENENEAILVFEHVHNESYTARQIQRCVFFQPTPNHIEITRGEFLAKYFEAIDSTNKILGLAWQQ